MAILVIVIFAIVIISIIMVATSDKKDDITSDNTDNTANVHTSNNSINDISNRYNSNQKISHLSLAAMTNRELEDLQTQELRKYKEKYINFVNSEASPALREHNTVLHYHYTQELDNLIAISTELYNRSSFSGLCDLIDNLILKMNDTDNFNNKDINYCLSLCDAITDKFPKEHCSWQIAKIYAAEIYQCEMYGKLKETNYSMETTRYYEKIMIDLLIKAFDSDLDIPYYMKKCLNLLASLSYPNEKGQIDPWWSIYWNFTIYNMHKDEPRFSETAQEAFKAYNHTLQINNLTLTNDMKILWENEIPFFDENGNCTLHPYKFN